nr:hypothetical protein [Tanacetum cinerariifolium]
SIISLGQKNTLAEDMILSSADNRPPMLDKDLVAKDLWERVQLLMQDSSFTVPVFSPKDDPIACLNKAMAFLTANEDLNTYDSDCDDLSNTQAVLMANISNYGSDVISEEKANKEQNKESITAKFERYKEIVKTFEQRLNIDLSCRKKMIDSQKDDMIKEKLALKEKVDSLEQ